MESLADFFKTSDQKSNDSSVVTPKEFIDGLFNDVKEKPIELYLYLIPVPIFVYMTSTLPKTIGIFTNVVLVGLYTNYTFKTFK